MSGWPDPARPGVPLNPEQGNTWHWVRHGNGQVVPRWWSCSYWQAVGGGGANIYPHEAAKMWPDYLGPCLTPAELAAREAAAFQRGAEAMREKALRTARQKADDHDCVDGAEDREMAVATSIAAAIRALPVPEDRNA